MSYSRFIVASALAILLWPVSASADWQFTHWGMTPEQVIAVSKGVASRAKPTTPDTVLRRLATMPYSSGNLKFDVDFLFSGKPGNVLLAVRLNQYWGSPSDLFDALKQKYGAPKIGASDEPGLFVERYWTRNGDDITFTWLMGKPHATLTYEPHDPARIPKDTGNGSKL